MSHQPANQMRARLREATQIYGADLSAFTQKRPIEGRFNAVAVV
jgi:hypothetical protein